MIRKICQSLSIRVVGLIMLGFGLVTVPLKSQPNTTPGNFEIPFKTYLFNISAPTLDKSRLTVAVGYSLNHFQFIQKNGVYQADIIIAAEVTNKFGKVLGMKDISKKIVFSNFNATVKSKQQLQWINYFDLTPAKYRIKIKVIDLNSKLTGIFKNEIQLIDFREDEFENSHLLFTRRRNAQIDSLQDVVLSFHDPAPDSLFIYVGCATLQPGSQLKIKYLVEDLQRNVLQSHETTKIMREMMQPLVLPLEMQNLVSGQNHVLVYFEYLGKKYYTDTQIFVSWRKYLGTIAPAQLKLSLAHLRIVSDSKEVRAIEKAPPEKQDSLLKEYWRQRDPTPGTEGNELYDELYRRIQFTTQHFSFQRREGWQTDRGRIYIKFGHPDDMYQESDRYQRGGYEIWNYSRLRLRFIFYDPMGMGEFRLVSQSY
ncbi:GWxTD domain-containing protein [candidate division KSB1 bacterium]|nr:GWxTD domain-containing protein [candidate division KSB1 bacterium]